MWFFFDPAQSLGFYPDDKVLDKLIHESDVDKNMVIDFEEFVELGMLLYCEFQLSRWLASPIKYIIWLVKIWKLCWVKKFNNGDKADPAFLLGDSLR